MAFSSLRPLFLQPCARILTRLPVVLAGIINQYTLPRAPPPPPSSLISLFLIPPPHGPANPMTHHIPDAAPPFPTSALLFPSSPNHSHHHGGRPACAKLTRLVTEPVRSFYQTKADGTILLLYYDMILLLSGTSP